MQKEYGLNWMKNLQIMQKAVIETKWSYDYLESILVYKIGFLSGNTSYDSAYFIEKVLNPI